MFKLKRVELLGFKSFADRTRLQFADGIAAIVGPNGCGKSNLADAVSWVLGEQSARSLRGERMADVIFNGTSARPATGMAEASLTLIDPESLHADGGFTGHSPQALIAEPGESSASTDTSGSNGDGSDNATRPSALKHRVGEITVTRRLFRSGESEYLINGETCRLRDIQDLFMGTGLGPDSYAIIEQGRIGQILSSKPSDRRAIVEEAAGVSKFKTRKRLAEAKLESSRQNLARITDILEEVAKQVNSLKRQASKARRYRELNQELRGRLKLVLTSRLLALEARCRRLREEIAVAQAAVSEAAQGLEELEQEQRSAVARHEELDSLLAQLRDKLSQGELERERLHSKIEQIRQRTVTLDARGAEAAQESNGLRIQLEMIEQEHGARCQQEEQLRQDWAMAQEAVRQLLAGQEALSTQLAQTGKEIEEGRQSLLAVVSQSADLRNQLVQAEETGLALERQTGRLETERQEAEQEHQRLGAEFEAFGSEHQRDEGALTELTRAVSETAAALEAVRQEESARRTELEKLRAEFSAAVARRQTLEESLGRHAYSTETVRRLLSGSLGGNGHSFHPLGVLADYVEVAAGYEDVVEEFLKQELDCIVVERHEEARSGISLLKSEGSGRSTFFVTQVPDNRHGHESADAEIRKSPGVVAPVRDLVRFESRLGLNGDVALPALANAYVVEGAETAERLALSYPECHFLTPTGEHYHHRLVAGGKGASPGPLAMRRDFRDLERRTGALESKLGGTELALSETAARAANLQGKLQRLTAAKLDAEKKAVLANEKLRQMREALDRVGARLGILKNELTTLDDERQSIRARQSKLRAQLETTTVERARQEEEVNLKIQVAREQRLQLDQVAQELMEVQARSSSLAERAHAAEAECTRLAERREEIRGRLVRLEEQCRAWAEERTQLDEQENSVQARLRQLEGDLLATREALRGLEAEAQRLRAHRDELNPRIDAVRANLELRREKRSETEVALARAESDHAHHVAQCRQDLNAEPDALLAQLPAEQALAGEALVAAEEQLRELRTRIENLGPVNMMALEELQETEERYSFLETQRQDLLASIQDTSQAIREIDRVSRQQFLEAFKTINGYFAESFRVLFGGGVGEMRLTDDSDPDSGIDIVAQPPGKRLQNVLLLSGGEKALAALAVLIALFRYTPSPFCILDEVDAPLDESNIDRFTRMVLQMSRHTQFILITHNKRTMETAEVLYGVTMEEPGISKLVSVRFDEAAPEPVAEMAHA